MYIYVILSKLVVSKDNSQGVDMNKILVRASNLVKTVTSSVLKGKARVKCPAQTRPSLTGFS